MTDSIDPDSLHDPRDAAAYWYAREQAGNMDAAERQRFVRWLAADAAHALEFRRAQGIWNATRLVPEDRLRRLMQEPDVEAARPAWYRRRFVLGAGATACASALLAMLAFRGEDLGTPTYSSELSTARGERRQVWLPDGSAITLNTATTLSVRYYQHRRLVVLHSGEAAFDVMREVQQAFHVDAGETTVMVTGTVFSVRRDVDHVNVAVASGSVEVAQGPWWDRQHAMLKPGQGTGFAAGAVFTVTDGLDMAAVMAWRQGRVIFRDTPLSDAVAEINRYAARPIRMSEPSLAGVRIAGAFGTGDTDAFLALLPDIAPVRVVYLADGTAVVQRR